MSKEANRRHREKHPDRCRARTRESVAKWRKENPDDAKKAVREFYTKNREAILARKRAYYQTVIKARDATPEGRLKDLNRKHQRRAQQKGTVVTAEEWAAIKERHGGCCAYCHRNDLPLEMDHIIALSKGGKHEAGNIAPACKPCNSSKGNR